MNEQQFWAKLQQYIYMYSDAPEITQSQWERVVQLKATPSLPTQLIIKTVCEGAVYLKKFAPLNFPSLGRLGKGVSLSAHQQVALEMALSNSAIAVIVGYPATGKTRIATSLVNVAITHQKRVLILTHHSAALTAYANLPGYPFRLSQQQNYRQWIITQLRQRHLAQPQMDYLPIHLLPDTELAKLRTPAQLEKWLPIIQTTSRQQLTELLKPEFPYLCQARVELLAYRLQQLEDLLEQQLRLSQLYGNLSELAVVELAEQLAANPQVPILGTVGELMQPQHQSLWQTNFDLVIVEEAEYLSWLELMLLSGLGQKLVLIGDELPHPARLELHQWRCFNWLAQHLLPAYSYRLKEQFRLHRDIATPIYRIICDRWMLTHTQRIYYHLPQFGHRLIWQDVPNQAAGEQIIEFIRSLTPQLLSQTGIITFSESERDWLKAQLEGEEDPILIDTVAQWAGTERAIAIVSCGVDRQLITPENLKIALTRGQDYLILFGDYDFWWQTDSPMRDVLAQPELLKQRTVVFS